MDNGLKLTNLNNLPEGFLEATPENLSEIIPGPAMIELEGVKNPPLMVSILLHGNEHSSLKAVQKILSSYQAKPGPLPRRLKIFVGNPSATNAAVRHLEGQPDYNRIWSHDFAGPERIFADEVRAQINDDPPLALIDIHNNTGKNPHYACVANKRADSLQLALLFGRTVVLAEEPSSSLFISAANEIPTVALECGLSGEALGIKHAADMIEACLHLDHLPKRPPSPHDIDLYRTTARLHLNQSCLRIAGGPDDGKPTLSNAIERFNFSTIEAGAVWGWSGQSSELIEVEYFSETKEVTFERTSADEVVNTSAVTPAMLTLNQDVIRQDCLGYLMKKEKF